MTRNTNLCYCWHQCIQPSAHDNSRTPNKKKATTHEGRIPHSTVKENATANTEPSNQTKHITTDAPIPKPCLSTPLGLWGSGTGMVFLKMGSHVLEPKEGQRPFVKYKGKGNPLSCFLWHRRHRRHRTSCLWLPALPVQHLICTG